MRHKTKAVTIICFIACWFFYSFAYGGAGIFEANKLVFLPALKLLSPVTDDIDLGGKDSLEFKWLIGDLVMADYFDFRLYKGYNTTAANLIFKQRFSAREYPIKVSASLFETGQIYTWVLVQVFVDGRKTDKSFSSFKIIKR